MTRGPGMVPPAWGRASASNGEPMTSTTLEKPQHAGFVVEWRDGFKIGVDQIDAEHRHLFTLVKSVSINNVQDTLGELLDYVVTHFTHEQDLMETSGFPDFR